MFKHFVHPRIKWVACLVTLIVFLLIVTQMVIGVFPTQAAPASSTATSRDYYVATNGSDSNIGTLQAPFATLRRHRVRCGKH